MKLGEARNALKGETLKRETSRFYSFSKNSHAEQEMNTPPGTPRSRSFTRFTIRVPLPHLGQSVLLDVSMTFLRSAVLAILAIVCLLAVFSRGIAGQILFGSKRVVRGPHLRRDASLRALRPAASGHLLAGHNSDFT